jgi:hypothetical protein
MLPDPLTRLSIFFTFLFGFHNEQISDGKLSRSLDRYLISLSPRHCVFVQPECLRKLALRFAQSLPGAP